MSSTNVLTDNNQSLSNSKENGKLISSIDYASCVSKFSGLRYLRECCMKLDANILTMATASVYYHKFFSWVDLDNYDPFSVACTCIYLASKVKNDDIKIRDIINTGYHTLHPKSPPLSLDAYFEFRDSLVECELLLMRMLNYDLNVDLPHKHLLFYLNTLKFWIGDQTFEKFPIAKTSWSIVNDSFHLPLCLNYSPELIAVSAIFIVLETYGIVVDGSEGFSDRSWFAVMHPDCKIKNVWDVCSEIFKMYKLEDALVYTDK